MNNTAVTLNFNAVLSGSGDFICTDISNTCLSNGGSTSLSMTFRSSNPSHWTADLAVGFFGTNQFYGGCGINKCNCGNNPEGSFPDQYKKFVDSDIPLFTVSIPLKKGSNAITSVTPLSTISVTFYVITNFYSIFIINFYLNYVHH